MTPHARAIGRCVTGCPGSPQRRLSYRLTRNAPTGEAAVPNMNRSYTPLPFKVAVVFVNRVVEVVASTVSISVLVPAVTSEEGKHCPV